MRGRVLYVGRDPDLPAFLSAYGTGSFSVACVTPEEYRGEAADLLLWDLDAAPTPSVIPSGTRCLTVGYREDADLSRPFAFDKFDALLDPTPRAGKPVLSSSSRELYAGAARVRLSPLEYDICRVLLDADGETVPAARLQSVGGRNLSSHALGVAISALRRKLDRLPFPPRIAAERKEGYRLIPPAGI
ncbi:MAG: winged helix-turn-helix transcriptional regulator [Clostridia bacterium]|nr:winged helix-turn-helix transcriptional regulator [Clostridia bacterium]